MLIGWTADLLAVDWLTSWPLTAGRWLADKLTSWPLLDAMFSWIANCLQINATVFSATYIRWQLAVGSSSTTDIHCTVRVVHWLCLFSRCCASELDIVTAGLTGSGECWHLCRRVSSVCLSWSVMLVCVTRYLRQWLYLGSRVCNPNTCNTITCSQSQFETLIFTYLMLQFQNLVLFCCCSYVSIPLFANALFAHTFACPYICLPFVSTYLCFP